MTREEFEREVAALNGSTDNLTAEDYQTIEFVYNFHPAVPEKSDIAAVYALKHGMSIIRDMVPTAKKAQELDSQMMELIRQRSEINRQIEELNQQIKNLAK